MHLNFSGLSFPLKTKIKNRPSFIWGMATSALSALAVWFRYVLKKLSSSLMTVKVQPPFVAFRSVFKRCGNWHGSQLSGATLSTTIL